MVEACHKSGVILFGLPTVLVSWQDFYFGWSRLDSICSMYGLPTGPNLAWLS